MELFLVLVMKKNILYRRSSATRSAGFAQMGNSRSGMQSLSAGVIINQMLLFFDKFMILVIPFFFYFIVAHFFKIVASSEIRLGHKSVGKVSHTPYIWLHDPIVCIYCYTFHKPFNNILGIYFS